MLKIVGIAGSPSMPSRSRHLVGAVVSRLQSAIPGAESVVADVAELLPHLAIRSRGDAGGMLEHALRAIESADLVIAGSPVYKGSYGGLFKHLVDLVDYRALQGVPVGLIATGGSDRHALVIEHQLRPLFASIGAHTLPTGVFVSAGDLIDGVIGNASVAARMELMLREAHWAVRFRDRIAEAASA